MTNKSLKQEVHMKRAINLAKKAWGETHCNPMVGSVIIDGYNQIVSEGYHERSGSPHAEIIALEKLKASKIEPSELTLFVTLEPCSSQGRTGACTDAIINSGIKKVVIGSMDPNPLHCGVGVKILRSAGIQVTCGILEPECRDLNLIYNHWILHNRPLCALKVAMTIDGCMAAHSGNSKWITNSEARQDVMYWRRLFPAIAVSQNTLQLDNPRLTSRIDNISDISISCSRRFILNRTLKGLESYSNYSVFNDEFKEKTIVVYGEKVDKGRLNTLKKMGILAWEVKENATGLCIKDYLFRLRDFNIPGIYIEPGAHLATQLIKDRLVDYFFCYQAPKLMLDNKAALLGFNRMSESMEDSLDLVDFRRTNFGDDSLIRGFLKKN